MDVNRNDCEPHEPREPREAQHGSMSLMSVNKEHKAQNTEELSIVGLSSVSSIVGNNTKKHENWEEYLFIFVQANAIFQLILDVILEALHILPAKVHLP